MELDVNNKKHHVEADPATSLLVALRDKLGLTGSKYGCGEGACGACKVLIDGTPTPSCITRIGGLENKKITTIEGLAQNGKLHPVQEAFLDVDVFQCAYCASGMIISSVALLEQHPSPDEKTITNYMNGHICRCGTYPRIVKAIKEAAHAKKG